MLRQPVGYGAVEPIARRIVRYGLQMFFHEGRNQEAARRRFIDAARTQIKHLLAVQLADRGAMAGRRRLRHNCYL